jgi:hypothetical protein
MLTVRNNLASHLVIPRGTGTGGALKLTPQGTAQVETLTAPLRDAERNGLVTMGELQPEPPAAEPAPEPEEPENTAPTADASPEPEDGDELLARMVALTAEGKSQREIARELGVNRNVVQRALRQQRTETEE